MKAFMRHLFVERLSIEDLIVIDELIPGESEQKTPDNTSNTPIEEPSTRPIQGRSYTRRVRPKYYTNGQTFRILILQMNRMLAVVFCILLIAIIVYPLLSPSRELPEIVPNAFSAILGYFVSAAMTFFERYGSIR